jgi:hypothetical protein
MHSLGPWLYDINPKAPEAIIVDFEGFEVAHISALENSTSASDLEDNVRLIAAAPNLLLTLKQMLREHDALQMANGSTEDRWPCATVARRLIDQLTD